MRILHVVATVHKSGGGTSEVIPRLAMEQCKLGHYVAIAALKSDISDAMSLAISAGVTYEGCSNILIKSLRSIGFSLEFRRKIFPLVKRADVVHLHGLWMYPPWCAGWSAQKLHKPYVMMPHGFLEPERLKISKWKKLIVGKCIEKPLLKKANAIVATSQSEVNGIRSYGVSNPVYIMPIGLDTSDIDKGERNEGLLSRLGCDLTKKHLLYFSRITPIKGLDLLAEAWGKIQHDGWQLLIVGPDDRGYANEVQKIFSGQIANGSVVIHDGVFGRDKFDLLNSVDAFVLPTRSENWSIAVAEALAARLPVVCTKGAPWSCINDVGAGFWVDVSSAAISEGLKNIISVGDSQRHIMGANGRRWVEAHLNWRDIARNMVSYYNRICR